VSRYSKNEGKRRKIDGVPAAIEYSTGYNGVDRHDLDTSDWSISVRTNRFYFRIFFWLFDATVHLMYQVAINTIVDWYKKYFKKRDGRRHFQIDLALKLGEFAIRFDWNGTPETNPGGKPAWMRQYSYIPCDCGKCFFCKTGRTNGITHKPVGVGPPPARAPPPPQHSIVREHIRNKRQVCKVCYKNAKEKYSGDLTGDERYRFLRRQCERGTSGCALCDTVVCEKHYYNGSFTHNPGDY